MGEYNGEMEKGEGEKLLKIPCAVEVEEIEPQIVNINEETGTKNKKTGGKRATEMK